MRRKPLPQNASIYPPLGDLHNLRCKSVDDLSLPIDRPPPPYSVSQTNLTGENDCSATTSEYADNNLAKSRDSNLCSSRVNLQYYSKSGKAVAQDVTGSTLDLRSYKSFSAISISRTDLRSPNLQNHENLGVATAVDEVSSVAYTIEKSEQPSRAAEFLSEASYMLGGLIKHPYESTKHFSILRHSAGVVYYKGPSTSIAITVFADRPLYQKRKYWLQLKGWSGNAGMNIKGILGTNNSWIDVTPTRLIDESSAPRWHEKGWQRDIKSFQGTTSKLTKHHSVRETAVLRIPAEATDGYFRVVLTESESKSILCSSPTFRIASTSLSASSIKGASLTTLPIELSINIAQFAATKVTKKLIVPWMETAQHTMDRAISPKTRRCADKAFTVSGASDFVSSINEQCGRLKERERPNAYGEHADYIPMERPEVVGHTNGPEAPFPLRVASKITRGAGRDFYDTGMPTVNLGTILTGKLLNLLGVYFGWALIKPKDPGDLDQHADWRQAIISVTYQYSNTAMVAPRKAIKAYLLHNYGGQAFFDSQVEIIIMGFLRPVIPHEDKQAFFTETLADIEVTRASLEREKWTVGCILSDLKRMNREKNVLDHCTDIYMATQNHIDSIPVHKLGYRSQNAQQNDRSLYGSGGYYINRDSPKV